MFEIKIQKNFKAVHALLNSGHVIEKSHLHTWKCEVCIEAPRLDDSGCVVDFIDADRMIDAVIKNMSDKNICELPYFKGISASTENIAKYIFDELSKAFYAEGARLAKVAVWEDENHSASYLRD